jgi:hypothetical protein
MKQGVQFIDGLRALHEVGQQLRLAAHALEFRRRRVVEVSPEENPGLVGICNLEFGIGTFGRRPFVIVAWGNAPGGSR